MREINDTSTQFCAGTSQFVNKIHIHLWKFPFKTVTILLLDKSIFFLDIYNFITFVLLS